jgi:phospholipid/cholesterol/gamma-HCH transport system ATP-binding protein
VRNFFLGHVERCAEEDVRRFRLSLDDTSDEGGVPAVLREEANV